MVERSDGTWDFDNVLRGEARSWREHEAVRRFADRQLDPAETFAKAARVSTSAPVFQAMCLWTAGWLRKDAAHALEDFEKAFELSTHHHVLADRRTDREKAEDGVLQGQFGAQICADAASAALDVDDPGLAMSLLEQGKEAGPAPVFAYQAGRIMERIGKVEEAAHYLGRHFQLGSPPGLALG